MTFTANTFCLINTMTVEEELTQGEAETTNHCHFSLFFQQ